MKTVVRLAFALLLIPFSVVADEQAGITLYPHFGETYMDDSAGFDDDGHLGLGVGYRFDNPWGIELTYQQLEVDLESPLAGDADVDNWHLSGLYHLGDNREITPYFALGVGKGEYDSDVGDDDETLINAGLGFKWFFAEKSSLRGDFRLFHGTDEDAVETVMSLGLHFALGGKRSSQPVAAAPMPAPTADDPDTDGDGVADSRDQCPGTPAGIDVDGNGCPRDDDGDGVYNYMDDCPGTTNRRARIDTQGCYVTLEKQVNIKLNVEFDFDSSDARPEHRREVQKVADFMEEYPGTVVIMEGHTDSRGPEAYNQGLSERRAKTIADMLVDEFDINGNRVSSRGYGESQPIDTNDTDAGRQNNRRVEAAISAERRRD